MSLIKFDVNGAAEMASVVTTESLEDLSPEIVMKMFGLTDLEKNMIEKGRP